MEVFWDPQRAENQAQEAPKTLSGPGSRWTWFRVSFLVCFWDPLGPRKWCSHAGGSTISRKSALRARGRKRTPKCRPKRPQKSSRGVPKWENGRSKPLLDFRLIFKSIFDDFGDPQGPPGTPQNEPKTRQKPDSAPGGLRGVILEPFWIHFGASGGPFSSLRRSIFECPGGLQTAPDPHFSLWGEVEK